MYANIEGMEHNTNIYNPETLLVMRGNDLEDAYYDALYQERKQAVLAAYKARMLTTAVELVTRVPRNIGREVMGLVNQVHLES